MIVSKLFRFFSDLFIAVGLNFSILNIKFAGSFENFYFFIVLLLESFLLVFSCLIAMRSGTVLLLTLISLLFPSGSPNCSLRFAIFSLRVSSLLLRIFFWLTKYRDFSISSRWKSDFNLLINVLISSDIKTDFFVYLRTISFSFEKSSYLF